MTRIRTVLLCHHDAPLHHDAFARWLASWSDLTGIVVIEEPPGAFRKRIRREVERVGWLRMLDILAFRLFYRVRAAGHDARWMAQQVQHWRTTTPAPAARVVRVPSPNTPASEAFIRAAAPDLTIALCKNMLAERVFAIARAGTVVLHPGICPEYRNAHGCFWALANDDLERVGMTLLRIDRGVDTGPVFGYFRADFDEDTESHIVIQHRMTFDNLDALKEALTGIAMGTATPIDTHGRESRAWGQPWLTAWWRWRRAAARRRRARALHRP